MAATITITQVNPGDFQVTIEETAIAAGTVTQVDGVPAVGTVKRVQSAPLSGAATTINPILGRTSSPGLAVVTDVVVEPLTAPAAEVDRCGSATYVATTITSGRGTLWHQSRPDTGSNNVIRTVYHIKAGW